MNTERFPQFENPAEPSYEIFENSVERGFLLNVTDNFIDQVRAQENAYDAFVYFDRGARLFGHLIRERWRHRFPEDEMPDTFFVKVGREMGLVSLNPDQPVSYTYPWESIFERDWNDELPGVRDVFERIKDNLHFKKLVKSLRQSFSHNDKATFDNKRVLLVDEFMASGATLSYGKELFSLAFQDAQVDGAALVARFKEYSGNPSIIKPVSGYSIPPELGDRDFAGVTLPSPPSTEPRDKFFIEPQYIGPLKRHIEEIEENIESVEAKIEKIPEHKRVKSKEKDGVMDFIVHPLLDKRNDLKQELSIEQKEYDAVKKKMDRYRQARKEISSIAKIDD